MFKNAPTNIQNFQSINQPFSKDGLAHLKPCVVISGLCLVWYNKTIKAFICGEYPKLSISLK